MSIRQAVSRLHARTSQDTRGLTLFELVISMAIMSLLGFAMLSIFSSSIRTQGDVQASVAGSAAAQTVSQSITRDVRTATAFRVTADYRIDIRTATGTCKAYGVYSGRLYSRESTSAIPNTPAGAKVVLDTISLPSGSSRYFTAVSGGVQYAYTAGPTGERVAQVGLIAPRVTGTVTSPCW